MGVLGRLWAGTGKRDCDSPAGSVPVALDAATMMLATQRTEWRGWELFATEPTATRRTVVLLPGAQCTALFYADVMADHRALARDIRLVAATPPGFGGRPPPTSITVAGYASLLADLVTRLDADVVVGHSYFANVALELLTRHQGNGPVVLLSPAFSHADEEVGIRLLGVASHFPVLGAIPWLIAGRALGPLMEGRLPARHHGELVAEMRRNPWRINRQLSAEYLTHLRGTERDGGLATRLVATGTPTWIVRGDREEVGLTAAERAVLTAGAQVRMVDLADAGHFVQTDQPAAVMSVILEAVDTLDRPEPQGSVGPA